MKIFKFFKGLYGALGKEEEIPKILVPPIYDDVVENKENITNEKKICLYQQSNPEEKWYEPIRITIKDLPDPLCEVINGTLYPKKQDLPLTEKLIEILSNSNKSLHYRKIYNIVVKEFDNTKDMYSVKSRLYYLSRKKKIENGKKPGTFKAKRRTKKA